MVDDLFCPDRAGSVRPWRTGSLPGRRTTADSRSTWSTSPRWGCRFSSSARFSSEEEAGSVLVSTREGFYVAIGAGRSVESYHFEDARHGHTEKRFRRNGMEEHV